MVAGQETEGAVGGLAALGLPGGGKREKEAAGTVLDASAGFWFTGGVRRAGAQEEGGGRAAGSGGFSRVTGAPPLLSDGWWVAEVRR